MIKPLPITSTARRRKNIVFVHDTNVFGGLEIVVLEFLRHLDTARFQPTVMVYGHSHPDYTSPPEFVERIKALNIPVIRPPDPGHRPLVSSLADMINTVRLLRRSRPDIVHIHTARVEGARKATLSARLAGVPVIIRTEHSSPLLFSEPSKGANKTRFFDLLTNLVVTVSENDRQEQINLVGRSPKKVCRIHNGVDMTKFTHPYNQRSRKIELGFDPDIPLVGTVGRLYEEKGHQYMVEAAAEVLKQISPVNFVIVGSGDLEAQLKAQAATLGITDRMHFAGYQPNPVPYMEAMDLAVMPSLFEGFSVSLLEFMALRKPAVVTDHPGLTEACVHEVTGLVVKRRNGADLAKSIVSLLRDPARAQAMGQAARQRVETNFTFDHYMNNIMSLYDRLSA